MTPRTEENATDHARSDRGTQNTGRGGGVATIIPANGDGNDTNGGNGGGTSGDNSGDNGANGDTSQQ